MSDVAREVLARLSAMGIPHRALAHAPTAGMRDCAAVDAQLGALTPKNILLTTRNRKKCALCLTRPNARFHTADISRQAGFSRLSFAPEEMLIEKLRAPAGSASPLGLMFESARGVALLVDDALPGLPVLGFHPCDNTCTIAMAGADFFGRFLPAVGVEPVFVVIHDFDADAGL